MDDISKELYEKIKKEFDKAIKSDSELNKISKTIESGSATYKEANEFTKRLTELLAKSVNKYANENTLPNGHFYQNIGDAVLEPLLKQCYEEIAKRCASVQKAINDMAKINIKPQEPEYDEYRSYEVVNRANSFPVYNEEAQQSTEKTMESTNYNYVDKSIQKNAEFQTSAGLTATVTRRYDGVGLHDGKQACQWCLSRTGSNVPYREAKQRGMFERHEGCGCTIEYVSAKGIRTFQDRKDVWFNEEESQKRILYDNQKKEIERQKNKILKALANQVNQRNSDYLVDSIIDNHSGLAAFTPQSMKAYLESLGYDVLPLSRSSTLNGVSLEEGGGYKILFGGDGEFQYHPMNGSHHQNSEYWKIVNGKRRKKRYGRNGEEIQ